LREFVELDSRAHEQHVTFFLDLLFVGVALGCGVEWEGLLCLFLGLFGHHVSYNY
jgi:hypothetical protein